MQKKDIYPQEDKIKPPSLKHQPVNQLGTAKFFEQNLKNLKTIIVFFNVDSQKKI